MEYPVRQTFSGDWLTKFVMRPLAQELMIILWKTPITPNLITVVRIVLSIPVVLCILQNELFFSLIALVVFFVAELLDHLDGMLARAKQISSRKGQLYELISDDITACPNFIIGAAVVLACGAYGATLMWIISLSLERQYWYYKYNASIEAQCLSEIDHLNDSRAEITSISSAVIEILRFCFVWKPMILLLLYILGHLFENHLAVVIFFIFTSLVWAKMIYNHIKHTWKNI